MGSKVPGDVEGQNIEIIMLVKPEAGGLGLLITEDSLSFGVYVKEIVVNKTAYLDKRMKVGDKILAIDGHDTSTAKQDYVVQLLQVRLAWVCLVMERVWGWGDR